MKFEMSRDALLKPIQAVIGVVERRQTMPILSNLLIAADANRLTLTGTDLEVELTAETELSCDDGGEVTVPGRKLLDICRALPEGATIKVALDKERLQVQSGRSRFNLSTLPAAEFPVVEDVDTQIRFSIPQNILKELLDRTHFSMAQQDVRYYLNGLLLEIAEGKVRAVATDGHRLALCEVAADVGDAPAQQVIVPRKGVLELQRLLGDTDAPAEVELGGNKIRVRIGELRFTSKLIDGRFPDYDRVVPKGGDKVVKANRLLMRDSLGRAAILSNEKYKGVRLQLDDNRVRIQAHNPEQEEAEDEFEADYDGGELEIGFNVVYLLDALGALDSEDVILQLSDANSSCLILDPEKDGHRYVVMPMRL
ncbi:MAG TPA: DNA polymerase III subunit beta [Gammaproteobacteria bacterium]|nr:DNA polymerase III subunit beta [Gammaproteobacteria bacterium]HET7587388.1 DNA polymerase III subunit beta [Gammaproteobacteria bacterium]